MTLGSGVQVLNISAADTAILIFEQLTHDIAMFTLRTVV
jgi:hypothetical protein